MIQVKHRIEGYQATADEIRKNGNDEIIAVYIPLIGWKDARELEIEEDKKC
ncbi:MAG: hypothetical protein ACOWWH_07140 [Eubacteriaceae bacterium]